MAEAVVEGLIGSALALLKASKQLKRKCHTLTNFLERLRKEIPNMKNHDGDELVEMESVMTDLVQTIETIVLQRRGKLSGIILFFSARQKVDDLDEYHARLVEMLETFRLRQGNRLESSMQNVERALEDLRQNQERDNREDLKEDRAAVQQAMRQETDLEVRELMDASEDMDDEEFDKAVRTGANMNRVKRIMVSIATRSQIEEAELLANITQSELVVDEQNILGTGSFGQVLAGTYKGRKVAVKRSINTSLLAFKAQDDLRKEAERWKDLKHKNIVCLVGTCIYNNLLLLVMERCDMSLFDLLYKRQEAIELDSTEAIARGIARGLAYLHSNNLIHRDLKPMNVMLSYELGRVKLSDFGLLTTKHDYASYTETSSVKGTWVYMAPEVLDEPAKWTTRADMYSFGLVLWEMLHREVPWGANLSLVSLIRKTTRGERPAFSESLVVRPWYIPLIKACWSQEAKKRPTAQEALSIIEKKSPSRRSTKIVKSLLSFIESGRKSLAHPTKDDVARAVKDMGTDETFEGGLKLLLDCIKSKHVLYTMETVAVKTLRKEAWRLNAIPLLLANAKSSSSSTVRDCLNAIAFIMSHEEVERCGKEVAQLGGGAVVVEVMDTFHHVAQVQAAAAFLILNMGVNADNKVSLRKLGAAKRVVQAMQTHLSNEKVQHHACGALQTLALDAENRASLMKLGAAKCVVQAMQTHLSNGDLQQFACVAIYNLALNTDNQKTLMKLGAGERIVKAMQTHLTNADVQEFACAALQKLATQAGNQRSLVKLGAAECIMAAMRTHQSNVYVQQRACAAMSNLSANDGNKVSLMNLGAAVCVVEAMRIHRSNADIQRYACMALYNLSYAANGKAKLGGLGAKEAAKKAKATHRSNSAVVREANDLLGRLS